MIKLYPLVVWIVYPLVMAAIIGLYFQFLGWGWSILTATYLPIVLGGLAITLLEWKKPYRLEWCPDHHDITGDLTFMLLVQVLLPRLLSICFVVVLLQALQPYTLLYVSIWPHQWSMMVQVLLMLLIADFLRYWLHRLAHQWPPLWRLHAVHHSPKKLYWLNVGRFHPIEKSLQYVFDALLFILLGVSETVLGLYFVFYAVNGFFQHCNIELRLGFLNYLISGPELHRWHHSRIIEESNHNYGNNLIIWDIVFGTRLLLQDRETQELGLINRDYPRGFLAQIKAPFSKGLDQG